MKIPYNNIHVLLTSEEEDPSIAENLTLMLDSTETQEKGEDNVRLASLRRALIGQLLERLDQAEAVGGLRSICYLQVCEVCVCVCTRVRVCWDRVHV